MMMISVIKKISIDCFYDQIIFRLYLCRCILICRNIVDYQYRKVDSDMSDDYFSSSGLWVAQSILTVVGKRGANGRYECRVKSATDTSPILTSSIEVTVNGK